jgi:branched-chain amino acid transport system permease protein
MAAFLSVLFDGVAYGSLLFVISVGMSVTMGLMSFINLAHGAFAMFGGYLTIALMRRWGLPFVATLPLVLLAFTVVGGALERTLYRRVSRTRPLDQVLFTIGLTFMASAGATLVWGPSQQSIALPAALTGQVHVAGLDLGAYRLFLIAVVVALGIDVLGLDPTVPFKYMVYFLVVVVVGGEGSILGGAVAAIALGVFDVIGKYYVPDIGGFIIYGLMIILLLIFPHGVLRVRK